MALFSAAEAPDPDGPPVESAVIVPILQADGLLRPWRDRWEPPAPVGIPACVVLAYPFLRPDELGPAEAAYRAVAKLAAEGLIDGVMVQRGKTVADAAIRERIEGLSVQLVGGTPDELAAHIRKELVTWSKVAADIKASDKIQ